MEKVNEYVKGILSGDTKYISKSLSLLESVLPEHINLSQAILEKCSNPPKKSIRIGITGPPGVGKSSFIESFGKLLLNKNKSIAVLAIDPSSQSGGSILGDKTRMSTLASHENVFIRPSPSQGIFGGLAPKTYDSIKILEAAQFDYIIVETVGVGQSEYVMDQLVDIFVLLTLPGSGDELQGIKRGIMEMANLILINKDDPPQASNVKLTKQYLVNIVGLIPQTLEGWKTPILSCSSISETGIKAVYSNILDFLNHSKEQGHFEKKRKTQDVYWFNEFIKSDIMKYIMSHSSIIPIIKEYEKKITEHEITLASASAAIITKLTLIMQE